MTDIESTLFEKLTKEKLLRHPTARNFDGRDWREAAKKLQHPTDSDMRLLVAALHYGRQITDLRSTFEKSLFSSLDQRSGILLSLSMANYNYVIVSKKGRDAAKALASGRGFFSMGGGRSDYCEQCISRKRNISGWSNYGHSRFFTALFRTRNSSPCDIRKTKCSELLGNWDKIIRRNVP